MEQVFKTDCVCGCEELRVEEIDGQICIHVFRYMPLIYSLKRRLKFLFTGIITFNEVFITKEEARRLSKLLG